MSDADTFLLALAVLGVGSVFSDRWLQSDHQATTKGTPGAEGRRACMRHVDSLTAGQAVLLAVVFYGTGTDIAVVPAILGLSVNAASHWWADRRFTLRGLVLATEWITHKRGYYEGSAAAREALDQSFHALWLIPSALIIAAPWPLALAYTAASAVLLGVAHLASSRALRREAART